MGTGADFFCLAHSSFASHAGPAGRDPGRERRESGRAGAAHKAGLCPHRRRKALKKFDNKNRLGESGAARGPDRQRLVQARRAGAARVRMPPAPVRARAMAGVACDGRFWGRFGGCGAVSP